jgi:hypothetical protein
VAAAGLLQQFAWGHKTNIAYLYLLHIGYIPGLRRPLPQRASVGRTANRASER